MGGRVVGIQVRAIRYSPLIQFQVTSHKSQVTSYKQAESMDGVRDWRRAIQKVQHTRYVAPAQPPHERLAKRLVRPELPKSRAAEPRATPRDANYRIGYTTPTLWFPKMHFFANLRKFNSDAIRFSWKSE